MTKLLIFICLFVTPIVCFIELRSLTWETNKTICDCEANFTNNAKNDLVLNVIVDIRKILEKVIVYVRVYLPMSPQDQRYQLEILKTTMDVEKVLNGVKSNFVSKILMENYLKSIDYEPKFPLKTGIYRHINFTIGTQYVPFSPNTKFFVELRAVGKIATKKGLNFLVNIKSYGITRG